MKNHEIYPYIEDLRKRLLIEGGFTSRPGGKYRPDATAWAIVALSIAGIKAEFLKSSRIRLVKDQLDDGRVTISAEHQDVIWPTSLAIMALHGSSEFDVPKSKAITFLLNTTGEHWAAKSDQSTDHNTAIKGWPWVVNTHSWVEPTALSIIALRISGYERHQRTQEAQLMLMDRQLPKGGWNYGNTRVFGKELHPMPETTGIALAAIGGQAPNSSIKKSILYLKTNIDKMQTPLSLGWSILGLSACGERPQKVNQTVIHCLKNQNRYGIYDTAMLSLMIIAFFTDNGIVNIFNNPGKKD
jgi:hypothetical protein